MVFPEPVIPSPWSREPKWIRKRWAWPAAFGARRSIVPLAHDQESGQTIISGMGELHAGIIVDRMKREFKVEANVGKPQVAYRETIRGRWIRKVKFVRQSVAVGGHWALVWITT